MNLLAAMWRKINGTLKNLQVIPGVSEIEIPPALSKADVQKPVAKQRKSTSKKNRERGASSSSDESAKETQCSPVPYCPISTNDAVVESTEGLMGLSPDLWTEYRVLEHFENSKFKLPLVHVHEMHARLNASHKFFCEFRNAYGASCKVWMTDVMLFTQYPDTYEEVKRRFMHAVSR